MRRPTSTHLISHAAKTTCGAHRGFTLLEMLLALSLIAVLLGGLASLVRVFSNSYLADERRVGKAQLARSISQMLSDDLGAAVQDPIQSVAEDPNRQFIRHFGLRGDSRSLQIDVVQPNLFVSTATVDENRRILSGGDKTTSAKQAPELKTIFYEFVPINAAEEYETKNSDSAAAAGNASGEDLGSTLAGSLTESDADDSTTLGLMEVYGESRRGLFTDETRPLVQKFGLSRRELDYETPDGSDAQSSSSSDTGLSFDSETGMVESQLAGSLTTPPDASDSTLASLTSDANAILGVETQGQTYLFKEPMTAEQIAMDTDDGTIWAPEVLDCRFSYFDGENWLDAWDSIEKNGLPIAIKAELKLAPLDDVDLYRQSPMLFYLPLAPKPEDISKLAANPNAQGDLDATNVSRLVGSLNATAGETAQGKPVDVFNSYRPLQIMRAAMIGMPVASSNASAFSQIEYSKAYAQSLDAEAQAASTLDDADEGFDLGGGFGGAGASSDSQLAGSALGGAASNDANPNLAAMQAVQDMVAAGAVFNSEGICVDFSNNGSYTTLEQIASEIGVSEPTVYEVVAYLPTTPLSRAKSVERRKPTVVRRGNVSTRNNANANSSRNRRAQGQNPYATGRARQVRDRTVNERTVTDRRTQDRQAGERRTAERGASNRQAADRGGFQNRGAAQREFGERGGARERGANARSLTERLGANGGWTDDGVEEPRYGANNRGNGGPNRGALAPEQSLEATAQNLLNPPTTQQNDLGGLGGAANGGLGGVGGATSIGGVDPFAVIDQQTGQLPFASADSGFDSIGGMTTPGLIETQTGANTVASPQTQPKQTGQKSTWIRGK